MESHLTTAPLYVAGEAALRRLTPKNNNSIVDQYNSFMLNAELELASSTVKDYKYKLGIFIQYCLNIDARSLPDVTTDVIRSFIAHLKKSQSPKSVNGYYKVVRSFFSWLFREDRIENHPMLKIKAPSVPKKVVKIFNSNHLRDILLLCGDGTYTSLRNKAMVLVVLDTGIRKKELSSIQVDDIDIKNGIITVMGKGARERVVGISKTTIRAIRNYYESRRGDHDQLWLTEEGKPLTYEGISSIFKTLKSRAGFQDVRLSPHTFRHTSGTLALLNGATEREVQILLGHSTPKMTQEYTATIDSHYAVARHKLFSPVDRLHLK